MRNEFKLNPLSDDGAAKAAQLAEKFSELLSIVEGAIPAGRDRAIATTKLQEAMLFVYMGLGMQKAYRKGD